MAQQESVGNDYVRKNTMIVVSLVALVVGFLGGIVLSAYKSSSIVPAPTGMPQQQSTTSQGLSTEDARMIQALEKKLAEEPGLANSWIQLGNLYFDSQQHQKAIHAYEKALALEPHNANVLTDLGVMYRRIGKPDKAIECFDRAMEVDPRHEVSRFNKGIVMMHDLNDMPGAIKAWEGLVRFNPEAKTPSGLSIKDMLDKLKQKAG